MLKIFSFLRPVVAHADVMHERRLKTLQAEIDAAASSGDRARLGALLVRPRELGLGEEDAALECEHVTGLLAALDVRDAIARGEPLQTVKTAHRAIAGETCHFIGPASCPDGLMDQGGKLFLTNRRVLYLGSSTQSADWPHVREVHDHERDMYLSVEPLDLLHFRFNSYVDALVATELAGHLATVARKAR